MFDRLLRVAASLVVVVGTYLAYWLLIVPWVEPAGAHEGEPPEATVADPGRLPFQIERLRPYFQPGDWELQQPIIVENPQFALLLRDYESLPGGRVRLQPCTLLFFPDGRPATAATTRRVLIMRAPQGAVLDFDQEIDLSRAEVGQLEGGRLLGQVTIRGNISKENTASQPGADELWISTKDVELRPDRIWTPNEVQFRIGRHHGQGRDLRLLLTESVKASATSGKPKIDAIRSFQLLQDVHLQMDLGSKGLLPGQRAAASGAVHDNAGTASPVEVRCRGRFRFDVEKMAANFEDQVSVVRLNHEGSSDRLSCDLLTLHFDHADPEATQGASGQDELPPRRTLAVGRIEARGQPVEVSSPAVGGYARAEYLEFQPHTNQLFLNGQDEVLLKYETAELKAAQLRYVPGENGSMGQVWATGPGTMRSRISDDDSQLFEASWNGQLQSRPHEGRQLIALLQDTTVRSPQTGSLRSDEIWLWLSPLDAADAEQPTATPSQTYRPDSLVARGNVTIDSAPLSGATNQLEVWFQHSDKTDGTSGNAASPKNPGKDPGIDMASSHYHVRSETVSLQIGLTDGRPPVLHNATLDGNVHFAERVDDADQQPIVVAGQQLQLHAVDSPQTALSVTGLPAHVSVRGLDIVGPSIQLRKETNRLWVDGAGRMTLPMNRDLQGNALASPQPLDVNWQDRMVFDGQNIQLQRNVVATTQDQQLQTETLDLTLSRKYMFGEPLEKDEIQVARIQCRGGVVLASTSYENGRRVSREQLNVRDLSIHQASGNINAGGPGWVTTIREGAALQLNKRPSSTAPPPPVLGVSSAANQDPQSLIFVKVQFQRGIRGNIHNRELIFADQTRCIYGPVAAWSDQLDLDKVNGPEGDEVILTCDQLALRQMGAETGGHRPIEMEALGNAAVEGQTFMAKGHRLTYTTAKELLVLEGTGQTDAQLIRQQRAGGQPSRASAQKILYWRDKNRVEVHGVRFGTGTWSGREQRPGANIQEGKSP